MLHIAELAPSSAIEGSAADRFQIPNLEADEIEGLTAMDASENMQVLNAFGELCSKRDARSEDFPMNFDLLAG